MLVRAGDVELSLDEGTATLIIHMLKAQAAGHRVVLDAVPEEISTGQAADLLGVSRPTVVSMVDRGELAARRVGTHRRLRRDDVLRLREAAAASRTAALDDLAQLSCEAGLYD